MPRTRTSLSAARPVYARATAGELLMTLAAGLTTTEAANRLRIPVGDVQTLLTEAAARYGVRARPALVHAAITAGDLTAAKPARGGDLPVFTEGEARLWHALATRSENLAIARAAGLDPRDLPSRIGRLRVRARARTNAQLVALGHTLNVLTTRPVPEPAR
ncbi:hypothetical protein ABT354_19535 [Streptomyces sp. NPDC000594]|uniref:hypothetical protein n=1 Tax=Streptomyces sp. NPDC000594 TaxID=3154261 RepID=UPI00332D90DC